MRTSTEKGGRPKLDDGGKGEGRIRIFDILRAS